MTPAPPIDTHRDGTPRPLAERPRGTLGVTAPLLTEAHPLLDVLATFFRLVPLDPRPTTDLCGLILAAPPTHPPRIAPRPPVITADRLDDDRHRDHFVMRAFVYADWLTLRAAPRPGALIAFHARHRARAFLHDPAAHDRLARLAATAPAAPDPAALTDRYGALLMTALATPPGPAMRLVPDPHRRARRPTALIARHPRVTPA